MLFTLIHFCILVVQVVIFHIVLHVLSLRMALLTCDTGKITERKCENRLKENNVCKSLVREGIEGGGGYDAVRAQDIFQGGKIWEDV